MSIDEQKNNNLLPFASLSEQQLDALKQAEHQLEQAGKPVYLIAFAKEKQSDRTV